MAILVSNNFVHDWDSIKCEVTQCLNLAGSFTLVALYGFQALAEFSCSTDRDELLNSEVISTTWSTIKGLK